MDLPSIFHGYVKLPEGNMFSPAKARGPWHAQSGKFHDRIHKKTS